jgi:hypothetical protein
LAIVSVTAFTSILLDQMLEKTAYLSKLKALESATHLARERIEGFEELPPIDKVLRVVFSFADHYITNYAEMSSYSRTETSAQLAAFVEKVAPELRVAQEVRLGSNSQTVIFDLLISEGNTKVAVEVREAYSREGSEAHFVSAAALSQLQQNLRTSGLANGVLFFLPGDPNEVPVATTASSSWPKDLNLRKVYGEDKDVVEDWDTNEEPVSLVDEQG